MIKNMPLYIYTSILLKPFGVASHSKELGPLKSNTVNQTIEGKKTKDSAEIVKYKRIFTWNPRWEKLRLSLTSPTKIHIINLLITV